MESGIYQLYTGKLLQVIQEKKYRRIGSTRELRADFRLITATIKIYPKNKNKSFREELLLSH